VAALKRKANRRNVAGMARYGIRPGHVLGISMPWLRSHARRLGKDHALALGLWRTGIHEARILATLIADPDRVTAPLIDRWTRDLDSWDVCDQLCANLLEDAPVARKRVFLLARKKKEYVRRAGFVLMARLAVSDKKAADQEFLRYLAFCDTHGRDERNVVRKAVNWTIRQIGKRNRRLHHAALVVARSFTKDERAMVRWIGKDALRELQSAAVMTKVGA